jgi:hypothetical protein
MFHHRDDILYNITCATQTGKQYDNTRHFTQRTAHYSVWNWWSLIQLILKSETCFEHKLNEELNIFYVRQSFQMVKWKELNLLHLLRHAYFSVDNNKFIWNSKTTVTDKVNLSLYMPWWQGSKCTVPPILSCSTTWKQVVNSMPWLLYAQWNTLVPIT